MDDMHVVSDEESNHRNVNRTNDGDTQSNAEVVVVADEQ